MYQQTTRTLQEILARMEINPPPATPHTAHRVNHHCHVCNDTGWLQVLTAAGNVVYEGGKPKIRRCGCRQQGDEQKRQSVLLAIDGLTEYERNLSFALFEVNDGNKAVYDAAQTAILDPRGPRGLLTLTGKPGVGKTTVLACVVNTARDMGYASVYVTTKALLDYLRQAFDPAATVRYDARWELLTQQARVLALDEFEVHESVLKPWAFDQLVNLIDIRHRMLDDALTLVASNWPLGEFPPKISSRLSDGRARAFNLRGRDMRPGLGREHRHE